MSSPAVEIAELAASATTLASFRNAALGFATTTLDLEVGSGAYDGAGRLLGASSSEHGPVVLTLEVPLAPPLPP